MNRSRSIAWAAAALLVLAAAKPKDKVADLLWTHPEIARFPVREVALLPVVTFDRNPQAQQIVERSWGQLFSKSGHRWLSATFARERLRAAAGGGDSLLALYQDQVRKAARVDSSFAPELARLLRIRTLLSVRVDSWEKIEVEPTQSGRASTTVWLKAALVDSSGALLWSVSGSERLEGQQYDPTGAVLGMKQSDLAARPIAGAAVKAPAYEEVVAKLLGRWVPLFPPAARDSASTSG